MGDPQVTILVGGLEHEFYDFPFILGDWNNHHPNRKGLIFMLSRGVGGSTT